jgi:CRP/FNR family transcriptional regulator, anaerobic regulatory protein
MIKREDAGEFRLTGELIAQLAESGVRKNFTEGDVILNENQHIRSIPIVTSGSVRVLRTDPEGRELLLYYIRSGESCIMSLLGGLHHATSKVKAIAEEATEVLFVPMDKVMVLMKDNPEWLEYILRLYHKRFEELLDVVNAIAFRKMDERILEFIRKRAELTGNSTLQMTHEQIANELGTARVVVSRLLKQMEEERLVKLERNRITLISS